MSEYQFWKKRVDEALSSLGIVSTTDYPLINFKKFYDVGKTPREAAEYAKAINPFLNYNLLYNRGKVKPFTENQTDI